MLLCDIGNSSFDFYDTESQTHTKVSIEAYRPIHQSATVYYINVNPNVETFLNDLPQWINIAPYIRLETAYETLGIDRKAAIAHFSDAVVVDAGSAITVDKIQKGIYQGGFIFPGFAKMEASYREISSRLDYLLNFELSFDTMPKNSQDAISYGALIPLVREIERQAGDLPLILTGGDGKALVRFFDHADYRPHLLFDAMHAIIKREQEKGTLC